MNSIITAAKAHFEALKNQHIDVPEWQVDGQPVRIYFDRPTLAEMKAIVVKSQGDDIDAVVRVIVAKSKLEDGSKMFNDGEDRMSLARATDYTVLQRIAKAIVGPEPDVGMLEKNC